MIEKIELSKVYGLKLLNLYGGTKYNCIVIGSTNIDNVANNENDYNIYDTFFKPVGLGLTSYYTAIQSSTTIYICKKVDSMEPLTINDEKIFIPETLIDKGNSVEYVECTNFNFNIYPIIRRFTGENEREAYITEISTKLKTLLKRLIDFSQLTNDIDVSYSQIYMVKDDIDKLETDRNQAFELYRDTISKKNQFEQKRDAFYNESIEAYNKSKAELDAQIVEYRKRNAELTDLIGIYKNLIERENDDND